MQNEEQIKPIPRVVLVILNWNGKHFLEKFLPSIISVSYDNLEIIVGDNASTDDSISFLNAQYPSLRIIENDKNYGFAEGYNRVLNHVNADYFILLNSDVEVEVDFINPIIKLMEGDKEIAACQPKIRSFKNKSQFEYAGAAGGFIDKYAYPFCRGRIFDELESDQNQYEINKEIFWASGAALFIRADLFKIMGGFDASFFAHMEEIDLCWRLKNAGHKIYYCPESVVYHVGGGTLDTENPRKTHLNFRNSLYMLHKNVQHGKLFSTLFVRHLFDLLTIAKFISEGKFKHVFAINKAHFDYVNNIFNLNRERKLLKSNPILIKEIYPKSIVVEYFIKKKKYFKDLNWL